MKVAVICRSDATGGAAVVSRRLTEALRAEGVDASLVVLEKSTALPFVVKAPRTLRAAFAFLAERLRIFLANGFSRKNLFKVDTGEFGVPLYRLPVVREADMVILNWVNQGMLSLREVKRLCSKGKRVVWTMHDMWNMTGICHHAMECRRFEENCGRCPLLGSEKPGDLSRRIWRKKMKLYDETDIKFVSVSRWLAGKASVSSLLKNREVYVIPNPFKPVEITDIRDEKGEKRKVILFSAAGLDNWIKGLDIFRDAMAVLSEKFPDLSENLVIRLIGGLKDRSALEGWAVPVEFIGKIEGEENIAGEFAGADIVVNSSHFENLPGTLIEGQAYGAVPVAFDRGGQRDIIDDGRTGFLARWSDDPEIRAANLAAALARALEPLAASGQAKLKKAMLDSVARFSYPSIARAYLSLAGMG